MAAPYSFDYGSLPRRRNHTGARPLHLDIEEANRRDARAAGETASPPATTSTGHRGQPWDHPTSGDAA